MQRFPGQTADDAPAPSHQYLADRAESDADNPELGAAAMEEDDATVIEAADGSADPRRVDPLATLQEATEKNAREAWEEQESAAREKAEAAKVAQAEADVAAKAQADAAAKEQADAAAKAHVEEASRSWAPESTSPQHAEPSMLEGQDYHNIHAAAYNSQVQELAKRTTDLNQSRKAAADLRKRLGEVESALHTKEQERSHAVKECDHLTKELADQADRHKAELQKLKDIEAHLQAEFETQRSNWAEKEKFLSDGYGEIEDMIDEFFLGHSVAVSQAIEARRDVRRRAGAEIVPNAPRNLGEQLLVVKTRLQPAHRMLHRLQCVGSQLLATLWPDTPIPRTRSWTADWLEIEAGPELAAASRALTQRAAAIAEYADTIVFIPELDEEGAVVPPKWFGLNPEDGKDSAEEITSSDEGEDEEDKDGEDIAPDDGADSRPRPDQASTNESPTAADADQAETHRSAAPPPGTSTSADPSDPLLLFWPRRPLYPSCFSVLVIF
nr:plectin-like [Aegilops tauschii subsp. strangulata]